ncbi:MAG: hypothetical protein HN952_03135 [Candidatus Cloacimonetes bacterium]|jgi:predicted RNase H-like nuclease (RuvC/YqgF family)|nr:hypothetical protein [Candidatus Cloacimonadota bacterium]MBT6993930.1 hypothetical protein [Candidatus Cloacimonadota bacterium]MBT7469302.1 hypothetical protein [Candidatus Cloacimonadota bacterium]
MSKRNETRKDSSILSNLVKMMFDIFKHFIKDFENMRKVNKIDKVNKKFSNLEHLIIRLEDKIANNRHQIEELKNRIMWGNAIILVLLAFIIFHLLSK